jgi:hypothetical protein
MLASMMFMMPIPPTSSEIRRDRCHHDRKDAWVFRALCMSS